MWKKKRTLLTVFLLALFLAVSHYQYNKINRVYAEYKVVVANKKTGDMFNFLGMNHSIGKAKTVDRIDQMGNKITEYHIPLYLKNPTKHRISLHPEFYRMMRGEDQTQTFNFINDQTKKRIISLNPDEEVKGTIVFWYMKIKKNDENKSAFLHMIGCDGKIVEKYIVQVKK